MEKGKLKKRVRGRLSGLKYEELLKEAIAAHVKKAAEYEQAGRMKDARMLRATGNVLDAILRGQSPATILP